MENNANFRQDLEIGYLKVLARHDKQEEFSRLYGQKEDALAEVVDGTTDTYLLSSLKSIIDYKKRITNDKGMGR
ncbi:MAG: hypothetical protein II625_08675 [Bacilli bacterium]|nr:hypothetical protein [Bacilli bacterium]